MEINKLKEMRLAELKQLATKKDIPGRSKMNKEQLIKALARLKKPSSPKTSKKIVRFSRKKSSSQRKITFKKLTPPEKAPTKTANFNNHDFQESTATNGQTAGFEHIHQETTVPLRYNQTRAWLLVRDPYWIYCCWELSDERIAKAAREVSEDLTNAQRLVRVYRIADIAQLSLSDYFDIEINNQADNWYINVPQADSSYCIEIGYRLGNGLFLAIVRSNIVHTPRNTVSDIIDEKWACADDLYAKIFAISGGLQMHRSGSLDFTIELRERLRESLASEAVSSYSKSRK